MKGSEIFHNYFDTVNANIRTAMEHKADERERDQGDREGDRTAGNRPLEAGTASKDRTEKTGASKGTEDKIKNTEKEIKKIRQPVKGR